MIRTFSLAVMLALLAASGGLARTPRDPWDCGNDPPGRLRWLVTPNIAQAGAVVAENTMGVGSASVQCTLNASGRPKACVVLDEAPAGRGFGKMAAELAGLYKAASKDSLGQPTAGRKVCRAFGSTGRSDGGPTG